MSQETGGVVNPCVPAGDGPQQGPPVQPARFADTPLPDASREARLELSLLANELFRVRRLTPTDAEKVAALRTMYRQLAGMVANWGGGESHAASRAMFSLYESMAWAIQSLSR